MQNNSIYFTSRIVDGNYPNYKQIIPTEEKTSAVHFMRFELEPEMLESIKQGMEISVGIDHENYMHAVSPVPENYRAALAGDIV